MNLRLAFQGVEIFVHIDVFRALGLNPPRYVTDGQWYQCAYSLLAVSEDKFRHLLDLTRCLFDRVSPHE